jgi:hypothetical protein
MPISTSVTDIDEILILRKVKRINPILEMNLILMRKS